jgi:hypothetical protein
MLLVATGLVLTFSGLFRFANHLEMNGRHYAVLPYYIMSALSLCFLVSLVVASIYLWRLQTWGLRACQVIFCVELIYWLLLLRIPVPSGHEGGATALLLRGLSEMAVQGNIGLSPQFVTLYPVVGLLLLFVSGHSRFRTLNSRDGRLPEVRG